MPIDDDPFVILGIGRRAGAEEICAAYRRAAKAAHPDRGGTPEDFRRVREAAETLLARSAARALSGEDDGAYRSGDRTSAEGDWREVADGLRTRWGSSPLMAFAPTKIGLSPFSSATALNAPAYNWLIRTVGARGEAWDFHIAGDQTRMFFRRADDGRQFQIRFF